MLKLTNKTLPVEIDGETYTLRKPKNSDAEMLMSLSNSDVDKQFQSSMAFLIQVGLPEEVVNDLDMELTSAIIEYLLPEKKE